MCSISLSSFADGQLASKQLRDDNKKIKRRLFRLASEADTNNPGALDSVSHHMQRMPDELKDIRKIAIGRHRAYYKGSHHACSYEVILFKAFKKSGTDDNDDITFQQRLINILSAEDAETVAVELPKP